MDLLQRARAGDPDAWRELVAQHSARLRRYLRRRMGAHLHRACSAGDLEQEVLLRVFRGLPAAPADASVRLFRRWLYRHADWVLSSRGLAARRFQGESAGGTAEPVEHPESETGAVTRQDQVAWLQRLIDRLAPRFAEVVRLRLEGRSFADVAQRLGIDEAAARQRFARVLHVLREAAPQDRSPQGPDSGR